MGKKGDFFFPKIIGKQNTVSLSRKFTHGFVIVSKREETAGTRKFSVSIP